MIILTLDTKNCMAHLLLNETFDSFDFIEGEITTYNKFTINGFIHKEFYEEKPSADYSAWKNLQGYCLSIIKGKRTPLNFKFILALNKEKIPAFLTACGLTFQPEDIQGLYLNLRYDGTHLSCTTGTSQTTFTLDKTLEHAWDKWTKEFFAASQINFEPGAPAGPL